MSMAARHSHQSCAGSGEGIRAQWLSGCDNRRSGMCSGLAICTRHWWDRYVRYLHPPPCSGSICRIHRTALPTARGQAFRSELPRRVFRPSVGSANPLFEFGFDQFRRTFIGIRIRLIGGQYRDRLTVRPHQIGCLAVAHQVIFRG